MESHIALIRKDSKHRMIFLYIGMVFIITGCYSLFYPFAKHANIARMIGLLALVTGSVKVMFAIEGKLAIRYWKRHIAIGTVTAIMGILLMSYHSISILAMPFVLCFWILSGGIVLIDETYDTDVFYSSGSNWMLAGSVLTIAGFLIVTCLPVSGSLTVMLIAAVSLIIIGSFYIRLSLKLKDIEAFEEIDSQE